MRLPGSASIALLAAAACASDPIPGSFVVGIDPHVHPSVRLSVRVTVDGETRTTRELAAPVPAKPLEIAVDPQANPSAAIEVVVQGFSDYALTGASFPVIARVARTRFVAGRSVLLPIVLDARCTDSILEGPAGATLPAPRCVGSATCIDGKCGAPDVPPSTLADYTPAWSEDEVCGALPASAELEVAREGTAFTAIADGDTLVPEQGAQGGYHVFLAFRARNVHRKTSFVTASATEVSGPGALPFARWDFPLARDPSGACSLGAVRWVLDSTGSLVGIQGKEYDATFTIQDTSGAKATLLRRIRI